MNSITGWLDLLESLLLSLHGYLRTGWAWIGGLLYVILIVLSMIHALLNKRNVRAATGWIGLIWFAPVIGIILYYLFGINRIRRRAKSRLSDREPISTPDPVYPIGTNQITETLGSSRKHLGSLAHLTQKLTQLPLLEGNSVEPLYDGTEAYPAMLKTIENAERSITIGSYIFSGTGIGKQFTDRLIKAQERGVAVRVIVDDVGARHSSPSAVEVLRRNDVPVKRFMHTLLPWKFRYANLRNHRKIMVVDGKIGFTGGMNISRKYWQEDQDEGSDVHRDIHFRLRGPIVSHLQYTFAEDWIFCSGEELSGDRWFPDQERAGSVLARGISHGPDEDYDKIRQTLLGAIATAEETIRIITPYFLPDDEILSALKIASMREVDIELFIPADINLRLLKWASGPALRELYEKDVTVRRTPDPFDHSKLMLVDDCWVLLGSTNWDARSLSLNFEFNVECYDKPLAEALSNRVNTLRDSATTMTDEDFRNHSYPRRIRDNAVRLFSPYL